MGIICASQSFCEAWIVNVCKVLRKQEAHLTIKDYNINTYSYITYKVDIHTLTYTLYTYIYTYIPI